MRSVDGSAVRRGPAPDVGWRPGSLLEIRQLNALTALILSAALIDSLKPYFPTNDNLLGVSAL
ncbi:hypothetical protein [Lichenifustis flavocetrariae]|uniref:Uncharacterized protein n=1 Tax=Lichenifustis flavocetrariae TaxID=2949735 RepID=A0AA41YZN3_9HYPH|nr:hypothetical protein [Lichenifustis flavocetrariae]MCW6506627.1 hypothetical protein [Lichenifustis flavocetrariae]